MYSIGYREAVLKHYEKNHSYADTCNTFGITKGTLHARIKRKSETDTLEHHYHGTKPKIDRDQLREYVDTHPDAYQREIAEVFGCSKSCIGYNLEKIGYTSKKRLPLCRAERREGCGLSG